MKANFLCYCSHCEMETFICGKCGNNTCNGGYGEIDNKKCDQCPSAYENYSSFSKGVNMKLIDNMKSVDECMTIHRYSNGYMVEVSGRNEEDDYENVKLLCNSLDDVKLLVEEYAGMKLNK